MFYFDELRNRYQLTGDLVSQAGLHIGTGVGNASTDAPFIVQRGEPFLPGSSLRGALRSTVERMLLALGARGRICILFDENGAAPDCMSSLKNEDQDTRLKEGTLQFCAICRLFGSTGMAARLKIGDAVQKTGTLKLPVRRDGVGIDRDTETAKEKIKYDYEVLERGCLFDFSMHLENAEASDFALLHILLKELKSGIHVGGKKASGLGLVKLNNYHVKFFDGERGHSIRDFLDTDLKADEHFDAYLKQNFDSYLSEELRPC